MTKQELLEEVVIAIENYRYLPNKGTVGDMLKTLEEVRRWLETEIAKEK